MEFNDFIKPQIKNLVAYKNDSLSYKIKMNLNENPYSLPLNLKKKIFAEIEKIQFNRYPMASDLKIKIANLWKINPTQIIIGNGSDELIQNILLAFTGKVLYPIPTFEMYEIIAKVLGFSTTGILLDENFDINLNEFNKFKGKKIIFISYPNNPTGNCFSKDKIMYLLENPTNLVVIDEAYFEFSQKTFLKEISRFNNLIILRTFSKAFGLAGIRIGYLISNEEIVNIILKVKLPFSVNSISQIIANFLLDHKQYFKTKIKKLIEERNFLLAEFKKIKYIYSYKTEANFILFKTKKRDIIFSELLKKGILIRKFNNSILDDYLRVTIGTPMENRIFIKTLQEIVGKI